MMTIASGVVMSAMKVLQDGIGLMATRSSPILTECIGIYFSHTCNQPPGAAHRSTTEDAF
jgi:hypothetical protein